MSAACQFADVPIGEKKSAKSPKKEKIPWGQLSRWLLSGLVIGCILAGVLLARG